MITTINIAPPNFNENSCEGEKKEIKNLSRVNIFIGPNNLGKSRFLRNLFSIPKQDFEFKSDNYDIDGIGNEIKAFDKQITQLFKSNGLLDYGNVKKEREKLWLGSWANFEIHLLIKRWKGYLEKLTTYEQNGNLSFTGDSERNFDIDNDKVYLDIQDISKQTLRNLKDCHISNIDETHLRIYIPILRGLRPIQYHNDEAFDGKIDSYKKRTIHDYFTEKSERGRKILIDKETQKIYTGLDIYHEIQKNLLNNRTEREKVRKFEDFLSKHFFEEKKVILIPKIDSDVLLIGVGDDERLIHELGDGIQSIIQILYPIFLNKDKQALVFIEEPEIGLHPGFQRILLETLLSEDFASMQFFITTHSNHFLDLTIENDNISVYNFRKEAAENKFHIKNVENPEHNILKELGIRNSSIFLSNCTIWVEGITDRKYIKKFLEIYTIVEKRYQSFIEDLHYSFVEYAGSNIVHWNFDSEEKKEEKISAFKITNNIFLIVDSDVNDKGKQPEVKIQRHIDLKSILKENFYITEGKEIENMLSPKIIKEVVADYESKGDGQLKFNVDLKKTVSANSFNDSEKVKKPIYWKYNLGSFIDENLKKKKRPTYKSNNTIKDKETFCDKAVCLIKSMDDLSEEAKKLCEKIFKFIEYHNQ